MSERTSKYQKVDWSGGLNTSVDSGLIPDSDLIIADNVVLNFSGSRLKREGLDYFGTALPSVLNRSSSGTTRTIQFSATVYTAGVDELLVTGEAITITTTATSGDEYTYYSTVDVVIGSITTTIIANDTITYTAVGTLSEGVTATSTLSVKRASSYINLTDYWRLDGSTVKVQRVVACSDQFKMFYYVPATGKRVLIEPDTGATTTANATRINTIVFNERLIVAFDDLTSTPVTYRPETDAKYQDLAGSPPDFSMMTEHLGRLWTNDKANPDRLHYSQTGDHEKWQGAGDSGAIDIGIGDGSDAPISGIFKTYKGVLYVAKGDKTYRIRGDAPENFKPEIVTTGLGVESHQAIVPVDQDDMMYLSRKGFHSLQATANYGDLESQFLSKKIRPTFQDWNAGRLRYMQGAYIPELNSVAYSVAEQGETSQSHVYLFNVELKEWYRWPNISCQALSLMRVSDANRLIFGTNDSRIIRAQNGEFADFETTGTAYKVKTGSIYPDKNPQTLKRFNSVSLLFKPLGAFQFTLNVTIDNYPTQAYSFQQEVSGDLLGVDFILGSSILGYDSALAPFTKIVNGIGRGIVLEITQSGTDEQVEIFGYIIEYEPIGNTQESLVS